MMTPTDSQKFTYELGQSGTAVATYVFDGMETEFALTNVCNPLTDMLGAMASMLANPTHLWGQENKTAFTWYGESESYTWSLNLCNDDVLKLRITQTCEFFGDDEIELVNGTCSYTDFVQVIMTPLNKLIKDLGILNYRQQWQSGPFPLTDFLFLKKYLIDNGRWEPEDCKGKDTLTSEVKLLLA